MSKILIVAGNETLRGRIDEALEKVDFEVITTSDGHQALKMMYMAEPDLIIMEEDLPLINGDKVYFRIRQLSNVPIIIVLNDNCDNRDKMAGVRALVLGADFYMTMPISFNELIARMRALLRRYKKQL